MTPRGGEDGGCPPSTAAAAGPARRLPGRSSVSVGVTLLVVLALLVVPVAGGTVAGPAGDVATAQADPPGNSANGGGSDAGGGSGSGAPGQSKAGPGGGKDGKGGSAAEGRNQGRGPPQSGSNGDGAPESSNRGDGKPPDETPAAGDRARGPPDDSDRRPPASGNGRGPADDGGPSVEVSRGPPSERGQPSGADSRDDGPGPTSVVEVSVSDARSGDDVSVDVAPAPAAAGPIAFDEVSLTVRRDADFTMRVTSSREPLPGSPAFEPGDGAESLGRVRLDHSIANEDVESVSFVVRVGRERLRATGTDPEDVVLYRFADGTWTELPTEVVGEAGRHYLLRVDSPGLSEFAVGAKRPSFEGFWAESSARTVEPGEPVRISGRVTNDGGATGVYQARLLVDGEAVAVRYVTVAAGGTRQVNFHRSFDRPGTYRVAVGDATAGEVVVRERAEPAAESSVGRFSTLAFDRFIAGVRALWTPWGA